jgi:hypothetical protein
MKLADAEISAERSSVTREFPVIFLCTKPPAVLCTSLQQEMASNIRALGLEVATTVHVSGNVFEEFLLQSREEWVCVTATEVFGQLAYRRHLVTLPSQFRNYAHSNKYGQIAPFPTSCWIIFLSVNIYWNSEIRFTDNSSQVSSNE